METQLKKLRDALGLTQDEIAHNIGVSVRTYQTYEIGSDFAGYKVPRQIAAVFGISRSAAVALCCSQLSASDLKSVIKAVGDFIHEAPNARNAAEGKRLPTSKAVAQ